MKLFMIVHDNIVKKSMQYESQNWNKVWEPFLQSLKEICSDPRKELTLKAYQNLCHILFSECGCNLNRTNLKKCFDTILLSLVNVENIEKQQLIYLRLSSISLISKMLLLHLSKLIQLSDFTCLWLKTIQLFYILIGKNPNKLIESSQEIIKNMILVCSKEGIFQPPIQNQQEINLIIWNKTWPILDPFFPKFKRRIISN
ncbi:golgi-specific brefeldin a-resistance guanine nucleotide exchange factor [Anaeramoeba flamelloides]|uniref:Golgi-specific brefeldin a-resistance guanine nucleotide exchange factor n=1 Tax=Anaeramoeba flamelloides TaxID=1746091 RepID=A0AAV7Z298_9EUKA|nr:golgi-specific brefeldin a-resistance guanine nucleotide exchange factor [Anaeramoeba flamelloides]